MENSEFARSLIAEIMEGEGTTPDKAIKAGYESGYDIPYGYGAYTTPSKPLSKMTVGEVKDFQRKQIGSTKGKVPGTKQGTGAVGAYQVTQGTLGDAQKRLGFQDDDIFTPELQDEIGMSLLRGRGLNEYLSGKMTQDDFQLGLAKEWASIADPSTGKSYYGQNTGTSLSEMNSVLMYQQE